MQYCPKCGNKIEEEDIFCKWCGMKVNDDIVNKNNSNVDMKCPYCGGLINIITGKCQSCGAEIIINSKSEDVDNLIKRIANAGSIEQKEEIIKMFPVPRQKRELLEFMLVAISNINNESYELADYEKIWISKFMQSYKIAKQFYETDAEFRQYKELFYDTLIKIDNIECTQRRKEMDLHLTNCIWTLIGIILLVSATLIDLENGNSSLIELCAILSNLISAYFIRRRKKVNGLDYGIAVLGGGMLFAFSFIFKNGSMLMLGGILNIIFVIINYFKYLLDI